LFSDINVRLISRSTLFHHVSLLAYLPMFSSVEGDFVTKVMFTE